MLTLLQRPSQCRVSECNDVEFAISYAVLSGLSLFGIFVYSILAMFFIELPFPCHQYTSKLEKAYRRRHRGLQHFQEAVLGVDPDLDIIAAHLTERRRPTKKTKKRNKTKTTSISMPIPITRQNKKFSSL